MRSKKFKCPISGCGEDAKLIRMVELVPRPSAMASRALERTPPFKELMRNFLLECPKHGQSWSQVLGHHISTIPKKSGKKFKTINRRSLGLLQVYDWPGNIRELQNVIERAVILCEGETFSVDETWLRGALPVTRSRPGTLSGVLSRQEKEMIEAALKECYRRISGPSGAAAKLGLPARTLDSKIKRFKINKYRFKGQRTS